MLELFKGNLEDYDNQEIVGVGLVTYEHLDEIKVDKYQRSVLDGNVAKSLEGALQAGEPLPGIVLGMRGQNYEASRSGMLLKGEVYVIDGLQRISAIRKFGKAHPDRQAGLKITAMVHFGTSFESEREKFHKLNLRRTAVSPNVILRNMAGDMDLKTKKPIFPALTTILGLTTSQKDFPLYQRVQWEQAAGQKDLIAAVSVVRTALALFEHVPTDSGEQSEKTKFRAGPEHLVYPLEAKVSNISLPTLRSSLTELFSVVEEGWGIKSVERNYPHPHLTNNFLLPLARVLSSHKNFWEKDKLIIPQNLRKKITSFSLEKARKLIKDVSHSGAAGRIWMEELLIKHINRGRSNKLVQW